MEFKLTPEQEKLRQEVRDFLKREVTEEVLRESHSGQGVGPASRALLRQMGERGWLTPAWPKEYGGLGLSVVEKHLINEECAYFAAPHGLVSTSMAGPTVRIYGSEEQKREWLPRISRGEIHFALGYTEPQAGSDLAALEIRGVEDGDDFVVSGQKIFNTMCHWADYHWLGVRTDPSAPKHRGISLMMVDLKSPGITIRPLYTLHERTNEVFYDNVRVPKKNLVGELNRGWYYIATALDFERTWEVGEAKHLFEELVAYCQETKRNGHPLAEDPLVRHKLAELAIELEVTNLLAWRVAWMQAHEVVPNYEAAMVKVFGSEFDRHLAYAGMEILGLHGQLQKGSQHALLGGFIEQWFRDSVRHVITRGTSEVMRNIIALRGLSLPRG